MAPGPHSWTPAAARLRLLPCSSTDPSKVRRDNLALPGSVVQTIARTKPRYPAASSSARRAQRGQRAGRGRGYNSAGLRVSSATGVSVSGALHHLSKAPAARMAGARTERRLGGAGGWLGLVALVACNVASIAFFLRRRSFVDDRRRRGGVAATVNDDGEQMPEEDDEASQGQAQERVVAPDARLNLELGDPMMYEAFWREVGIRASAVVPGSATMSYVSSSADADADWLCWFLEPALEREARRLHRLVGNAAADDGYRLVVGNGATQLFQAAVYALSRDTAAERKPVPVVSAAPYYSSYPPQTNLQQSSHFRWAGDANAFTGGEGECIELVCSPNNPDGAIREAVVKSGMAVHDLVYYWPQYTAITGPAAHDIMLFTLSKITGHAGTRIGWALVRDREVASKMVYFVDRSTIGVSRVSQLRAAKVLRVVSDSYEHAAGVPRLFDFARRRLAERWRAMRAAVAASGGAFSLQEETSEYCNFAKKTVAACPAFAWLRCEMEDVEDCAAFLAAGLRIAARGGEQFGGDARCVRVNMMERDQVFDMLVKRIAYLKI